MLHTKKSLKQRLLSGGAWSFVAKVGASFLTIALAAIVARLLSPDDVGVFFLSYRKHIGYYLAEKRYIAAKEFINAIILIVFVLSFAISAILYFFPDMLMLDHLYRDELGFSINLYLAVWLPVTAVQFLFAEIFRSYHNLKYASIFAGGTIFGGFLSSTLFGIVISIGYATGSSFYLEEILQILFSIMIFLLLIEYKMIRKMVDECCKLDGQQSGRTISVKKILHESYPFFISAFSFMLLVHADTIILGFFEPETEVAIYNSATRIAKLMVILHMIVIEVTTPVIVELNLKGEKKKLEDILRVTATIATMPSVVVLLFFVFFGEPLLGTVYGDFYASGALLLVIMSAGQLVSVWAGLGVYALNMMGFQKISMHITLSTSLVAIAACILIAPQYGAVAVAMVIAVALIVKSVLSMWYVYKLTGLRTYAKIIFSVDDIKKLVLYVKS